LLLAKILFELFHIRKELSKGSLIDRFILLVFIVTLLITVITIFIKRCFFLVVLNEALRLCEPLEHRRIRQQISLVEKLHHKMEDIYQVLMLGASQSNLVTSVDLLILKSNEGCDQL